MVVEDEVDERTQMVADMNRTRGTIEVPTIVMDHPQARGVRVVPEDGKKKPLTIGYCGRKGHKESECGGG